MSNRNALHKPRGMSANRMTVGGTVTGLSVAVCGMAKLPVELLQMIFDALAATDEMNPHCLNAVCTQWRAVIRAQPRYWTTLVFRRPVSTTALKDRLALSRGQVRRLELYGVEAKHFTRMARGLNKRAQGVEKLSLYATDEHPFHLENIKLLDCYPRLLSLHGNGKSLPRPSPFYLQFPAISDLLQVLVLEDITHDVYYVPLVCRPSPCPGLRSLRTSKPPSSNTLEFLLANHPLLESLILNGAPMWSDDYKLLRTPPPPVPGTVHLNQLRTLHLHLPRASRYEINTALLVPKLESLHLHSCNARSWLNKLSSAPPTRLLELSLSDPGLPFHRLPIPPIFAENLKRFAFTSADPASRGLTEFIVACPVLVHLDLSHTGLVERQISRLVATRRSAGCVPLESLVVQHLSAHSSFEGQSEVRARASAGWTP
jgi:hypothetical protein